MTLSGFEKTLLQDSSPKGLSIYLEALWHDAKGNWDKAHDLVQEAHDQKGDRIHAYLHRKEGDLHNANYWYSRAGQKMPEVTLQEEWQDLAVLFL